jgi:uncharacterized protein with GYD domain
MSFGAVHLAFHPCSKLQGITAKANKGGFDMPIFMMFGKYSTEALKGISSERTDKAVELIKKNGGKVISMYAVIGEHDLVLTLDFPIPENAIATSVALNKLTGISFTTSPVVEVEKFDKLISEVKGI